MNANEIISKIIDLVCKLDENASFLKDNTCNNGLIGFVNQFEETVKSKGDLSNKEVQLLSDLRSLANIYLEQFQTNPMYFVNKEKILDEDDLEEFRVDWENSKTGKKTTRLRDIQRYRSYTEFVIYNLHESNFIIEKYQDATHPLINATIAEALMNGGFYQEGLSFLANGLNYTLRFPNLYWHNEFAMIGCSKILWMTLWLITNREHHHVSAKADSYWFDLDYRFTELLFMVLTRAIDMAPKLPQTCDLLSNRAELLWHRYSMGVILFSNNGFPISTMEVQYIGDKKHAFERACKIDHSLAGLFYQKFNESLMMYRYGELRPNRSDVTPMSINDDVSFDEMKQLALYRSDAVACNIYKKFRNHSIDFSRTEIQQLVLDLREIYQNVSTREEFFELYNLLQQVFEKEDKGNTGVETNKILFALDSANEEVKSYQCYKEVYDYFSSTKEDRIGKWVLDEIVERFSKIERHYNWESIRTKPLIHESWHKEMEDINRYYIDETDASISYDDQGNVFH